ncbi:MAG: triose-phosphate isomerase [Candidatus Bipolaricaulia bacterium]
MKIIAANWKMYKTIAEARQYVRRFRELVAGIAGVEVVIAPSFTALAAVGEELQGTGIGLAAQDMWHEAEGAYTGEVSPLMLRELGCNYVILGHSERRRYFHEDDELVNLKLKAAFQHGLVPILCVGEKLEERRAGQTEAVLEGQIGADLAGLSAEQAAQMVIAYEPIWAIGTGETALPEDANAGAGFIRRLIEELYDGATAQAVRIQYGGSVTPENVAELMKEENIDGALVGGASLDPERFAEIVKRAGGF